MAWFGKPERQEEPSTQEANIAWVRSMPTRSMINQWDEIILTIEDLLRGNVLYYPEKQPAVIKNFHIMKQEWLLIDRKIVTDEEALSMFSIVNFRIPNLLVRIGNLKATRDSMRVNHEEEYLTIINEVQTLLQDITNLKVKSLANKISRYAATKEPDSVTTLRFPEYSDLPTSINDKLNEIRTLWEEQKEKVHKVEEEYILERIVTDYIPSSIELFRSFKADQDIELYSEAKTSLAQQLSLIQKHLNRIRKANLEYELRSMNAHTSFLEERFRNE